MLNLKKGGKINKMKKVNFSRINDVKNNHYIKKTTKHERQIDQLVYKLYDLTPEEIKIMEGKR